MSLPALGYGFLICILWGYSFRLLQRETRRKTTIIGVTLFWHNMTILCWGLIRPGSAGAHPSGKGGPADADATQS